MNPTNTEAQAEAVTRARESEGARTEQPLPLLCPFCKAKANTMGTAGAATRQYARCSQGCTNWILIEDWNTRALPHEQNAESPMPRLAVTLTPETIQFRVYDNPGDQCPYMLECSHQTAYECVRLSDSQHAEEVARLKRERDEARTEAQARLTQLLTQTKMDFDAIREWKIANENLKADLATAQRDLHLTRIELAEVAGQRDALRTELFAAQRERDEARAEVARLHSEFSSTKACRDRDAALRRVAELEAERQ